MNPVVRHKSRGMQRIAFSVLKVVSHKLTAAKTLRRGFAVNIVTPKTFAPDYEYAVTDEETNYDPKTVKVAFLRDHVRLEMFELHKSNPTEWTEDALSKRYGASVTRVRAVLYLMQLRENKRNELLGTTDGTVPSLWKTMYAAYEADKEKYTPEVLFEEFCKGEITLNQSPIPVTSPADVKNIIQRVEEHMLRAADVEVYNERMEATLSELEDAGSCLIVTHCVSDQSCRC